MKTLLIVIFLQVPILLPFNSNRFLNRNKSEFEMYSKVNGQIIEITEKEDYTIIQTLIGNKPVLGYYVNDTIYRIAFYFDSEKYELNQLFEMMDKKCATLGDFEKMDMNTKWISFPSRDIAYDISDSEKWYIINAYNTKSVK